MDGRYDIRANRDPFEAKLKRATESFVVEIFFFFFNFDVKDTTHTVK